MDSRIPGSTFYRLRHCPVCVPCRSPTTEGRRRVSRTASESTDRPAASAGVRYWRCCCISAAGAGVTRDRAAACPIQSRSLSHPLPCRAVPCRAAPCRAAPCHAMPCRAARGQARDTGHRAMGAIVAVKINSPLCGMCRALLSRSQPVLARLMGTGGPRGTPQSGARSDGRPRGKGGVWGPKEGVREPKEGVRWWPRGTEHASVGMCALRRWDGVEKTALATCHWNDAGMSPCWPLAGGVAAPAPAVGRAGGRRCPRSVPRDVCYRHRRSVTSCT